jgi:PAS domain S-box-containing protein
MPDGGHEAGLADGGHDVGIADGGSQRFRAIFDHAALGIAVVRPGGQITEVNRALTAMFGRSAPDFQSVRFADLLHPDDLAADAVEARSLLRGEIECYTRENRYRRCDGGWFWGRVTVSLVPGDVGGRFAVVMIEDIDARKRAEDDLSMVLAVMESAHEGVVILSPSGRILYGNSAYGRLLGLEIGDVLGRTCRDFFPHESRAIIDLSVAPALMRGESWEGVLEAQDASGRRFPLWQRAGAVRDARGRVKFYFAFMHDQSAQQNFEDELFAAKDAAEAANVAKTRFLAAASHDLRQPLQALGMFVSVLAERVADSEQVNLVARIQDSVSALEGLLNSLLDVSKLEAGLVVPQKGDFAAFPMMTRLAGEFEPLCEVEGLMLMAVPSTLMVRSDPALLERILRNLLNNAVRYTNSGRILFGCRRRGHMLRFEVWDTGIGIPVAELKNIFREFHQVGNLGRDRRQGLGLGLAIVERLARLLDHRIEVRSVEGKGSMFAVEVPIINGMCAVKPAQLPLGLSATGAAIIVIDDEPDVLESLRLLLEAWGHVVLPAASAEEAIRMLPAFGRSPDLIIADYRLQSGDTGGQAIARVEVHLRPDSKVPAIILTGDTAPERLRQAQAEGHGLLHKPVRAEALRTAIDDVLSRAVAPQRRSKRARKAKG